MLSLETLKRALSLSNRWRDSLVAACLSASLVPLLLQRLDWRSAAVRREQQEGQQEVGSAACCWAAGLRAPGSRRL